jgi:murein L,D-transpeptidase YafK
VASSDSLAARIHLGASRRAVLARAHTVLTEAEVYERHGDFSTATVRARLAVELASQVRSHAAEVAARYADAETLARWQQWRDETIAWSRREGRAALIVAKEAHRLTLFVKGIAVRTYNVDLGFNWISDKSHAGDGATPEGRYRISARKANGQSVYYKALLLDYPNAADRTEFSRAKRAGDVPASATIGGLIEIHGEGGRGRDWTKGCVAITNAEMDELFSRVAVGTPVTIVGSDNYGAIAELGGQPRGRAPEHQD